MLSSHLPSENKACVLADGSSFLSRLVVIVRIAQNKKRQQERVKFLLP
jgi:hypothetical protein